MTSAISIKDRLKNQSMATGKTMQEVLTAYGLERTIYRLSVSEYTEKFTLKGGILLYALFEGDFARATSDIDLLAKNISNTESEIEKVFKHIFSIQCDDAIRFDLDTLQVRSITEFKEYHGVNVGIIAFLDRTRIPVSIDIGFGDVVHPDRVKIEFPSVIDMATAEIYAYSICSVIAEKFEAIVSLGEANSRYKDFYDIYILAVRYEFEGSELQKAIVETFNNRRTGFEEIVAFDRDFTGSAIHQNRWTSFIKKKKALVNVSFEEAIGLIKMLLEPIVECVLNDTDFNYRWDYIARKWK